MLHVALLCLLVGQVPPPPAPHLPSTPSYPTLAIDLPLKALVWEDAGGRVWVSTNSPEYMRRRHGLAETPFVGVPRLLAMALG